MERDHSRAAVTQLRAEAYLLRKVSIAAANLTGPDRTGAALLIERTIEDTNGHAVGTAAGVRVEQHHLLGLDVQAAEARRERRENPAWTDASDRGPACSTEPAGAGPARLTG